MEATLPNNLVLAGKYRLLRQLGKGGMGSVWYAEHMTLHSPVAIKLIEPSINANPEALQRFLREAQAAASLRSPHVVQILDHGVDNGIPFIVMEVLEGESLADRLAHVGKLAPVETARVFTQVARAVRRAHDAGIVHRDLKPDNVYLVRNDDEEIAKVLDFGIAKSTTQGLGASSAGSTRTGAMLGTPYYMSPEQAEGVRTLDHRTDIWALGVIAFECLVGRRPFDGETLGSLLLAICTRPMPVPSQYGAVPAGFDAWFSRACARDLNERFSSAKDAAAQLKAICEGSAALPSVPPDSLQSGPVRVLDAGVAAASSLVNSGGGFSATNVGLNAGSRRGRTIIGVAVGLLLLVGISAAGVLIWRTLSQQAQPELPHRATTQVPSVAGPPPPAAVPPVQVAAPVVSVAPLTTKSVSSEASHEKPPSALTPKVSKPAQAPSKPAQAPAKPAVQEVPKVAPTKPRVNLGI